MFASSASRMAAGSSDSASWERMGRGSLIGKRQLYTACAGVPLQYLLPMNLDVGTNNEQYLHGPLYLGMRKARPSTE
jgi:malate dehydrogenase (oxaloacetate-decarboxylating)(NADP+)